MTVELSRVGKKQLLLRKAGKTPNHPTAPTTSHCHPSMLHPASGSSGKRLVAPFLGGRDHSQQESIRNM